MKLKRVITLPTITKETLTLEMDVDAENFIYSVDFMEKRVQDVYDFYEGKTKVPKFTPKKKEEKSITEIKPKYLESAEGTAFDSIPLDATDFNLFNVEIKRVGEVHSGDRKDGGQYQMQSVSIKDTKGKTRELIAWGDHNAQFDSLQVGDMLDIDLLSKVTEYKNKKGVTTIQYLVGGKTVIRGAE